MHTDHIQQYERLSRMIDSSSNLLQLETTAKLLELFRVREPAHPELHEKLQVQFTGKARQMYYFEWKYKDFDAEAA
ncbi:MAG: hypothetical protein FD123_1385 [Bacteroidetes bacterium]|nr:MAG: hypothetical protein FD123_1385 [Bacteroidota bacterium]